MCNCLAIQLQSVSCFVEDVLHMYTLTCIHMQQIVNKGKSPTIGLLSLPKLLPLKRLKNGNMCNGLSRNYLEHCAFYDLSFHQTSQAGVAASITNESTVKCDLIRRIHHSGDENNLECRYLLRVPFLCS